MRKLIVTIIAVLYLSVAYASQEGLLPFSEFQIKSNGIGNSGSIIVNGRKNNEGEFISLSVIAFGQTISIPQSIMSKISSINQNGIQLTYEHGYEELCGKTIYLQFQVGFTSGMRQILIIAVSEDGNIKVVQY